MNQHLFVYGTLQKRAKTDVAEQLNARAGFIGLAYLKAQLFLIEDYPGAIDSSHPDHKVLGEVYILPQGIKGTELLSLLDQYEECAPHDPEPTEYIRVERSVEMLNGETLVAFVYLYNHSIENLSVIENGDFLNMKLR